MLSVFTVIMANLAPIVLVPLFFKLTPIADQDLAARVWLLYDHPPLGQRIAAALRAASGRRTDAR